MQRLSDIRRMLDERGLRPRRSLGQNFLVDHNLIRRLVEASGVGEGDLVLEVGPGTGTLTEELLSRGCEVVACEIDRGLAALVRERAAEIAGGERLTVVEGDCLQGKRELAPGVRAALGDRPFSLVANLPYNAASPLLTTLLVEHAECCVMAVTVQLEVAERLCAKPGSREYGPPSVIAQAAAEVSRVAVLGPECFWPRPEVRSAMVVLRRRGRALTADIRALSGFCRVLFASPRKQIGAVLGRGVEWPEGVRGEMRAGELGVKEVEKLRLLVGINP